MSCPERHPIQDTRGYLSLSFIIIIIIIIIIIVIIIIILLLVFFVLNFTPGPLFFSFPLIVLVPLIQSHFQPLLSFLTGRRETRDPGKDLSLVLFFSVRSLCYCPTSSPGFTDQGPPVFVSFFSV